MNIPLQGTLDSERPWTLSPLLPSSSLFSLGPVEQATAWVTVVHSCCCLSSGHPRAPRPVKGHEGELYSAPTPPGTASSGLSQDGAFSCLLLSRLPLQKLLLISSDLHAKALLGDPSVPEGLIHFTSPSLARGSAKPGLPRAIAQRGPSVLLLCGWKPDPLPLP